MGENRTRSALIVIDMENGFTDSRSPHCIVNAKATVPACVDAVRTAREKGIPVFFVKRIYRQDGSDVELSRYRAWKEGGRAMGPGSTGPCSAEAAQGLKPQKGDYTIIKPRWSAFFGTELDLLLRRLRVETVILIGTTTPNCIRTTCYDANALDYNVVILEDCCSSQTEEIQRVNIADMERMGAVILDSVRFREYSRDSVPPVRDEIAEDIRTFNGAPEPFEQAVPVASVAPVDPANPVGETDAGTGWFDRW